MSDEQVSKHFRLSELLVSSMADERGIANTPTEVHLARLHRVLAPGLEEVRRLCGERPIVVTSAYRSLAVNRLVGGTATSAHPKAYAADISVAGLSAWAAARMLADAMITGTIGMDQLILESGRNIVHVSFDPKRRMMRGRQTDGPGTTIDWAYFDAGDRAIKRRLTA